MRGLDRKEVRIVVCGQCLDGGNRWSEPLRTRRAARRKVRQNAKTFCRKCLTINY
jgi:hypothetical protein